MCCDTRYTNFILIFLIESMWLITWLDDINGYYHCWNYGVLREFKFLDQLLMVNYTDQLCDHFSKRVLKWHRNSLSVSWIIFFFSSFVEPSYSPSKRDHLKLNVKNYFTTVDHKNLFFLLCDLMNYLISRNFCTRKARIVLK